MNYALKMISVVLALGVLALQGCQTTNTIEKKSNISKNSYLKKSKQIAKKPQYAPYDWTPSDINSREVWFEKKIGGYWCEVFFSTGGWKSVFLRNGNVIIELNPSISRSWSGSSITKELIDISFSPKEKLIYIEGIEGIKPSPTIKYEIKDGFDEIKIKHIYNWKKKDSISNCTVKHDWVKNAKKHQLKIEQARAQANQRILKSNKFAPILQAKKKETNNPVIEINSLPEKVDNLNLIIRGNVNDDSGVAIVLMQGEKVKVTSDGRFVGKIKLGYGLNKIKIQAEDINGNVAEKIIKITREEYISEQMLADVDLPPKTKMRNPDALGVVIGVENYQYVPDATYAYNDAEVFREYLSETLGFKKQRIKIATNSKATQAELNKLLGSNGWISRNIVIGKSDVVVYFSGHGIANSKNNNTGILPFDVDPNYAIGLPLKELYYNLSKMGAKTVTVYLDACFTGQTRDSKMLIADARPIIISPNKDSVPSNVTVFSASTGSQISGAIKEKEHGLFTYYLLKGMSGDADINKDKSIQINELSSYVSKNVKDQAAINGREQTPELQGDKERVLVQFN